MTSVVTRSGAAFALAGVAFIVYPLLRPYVPEEGLAGARSFAGAGWLVAHTAAMAGFVLLALALRSWAARPPGTWRATSVRRAELVAWLAVAFLLPYYGAEAFGLRAVGSYAVEHGAPEALSIADTFRMAPFEVTTFGVGLLLLAAVGVLLTMGLWHSGGLIRLAGAATGLGLVLFLPQFFGSAGLRIGHGFLLGAGLLALGMLLSVTGGSLSVSSASGRTPEPAVRGPVPSAPPTAGRPEDRAPHAAAEG